MSLKDVELTGVVTLFYGELCSELDIVPSKDPIRKKIYNHYKAKFEQEKTDVHHLLSMYKINFQGILNVAYRNYKFDEVVQKIISSNHPSEVVNLGCGMDTRFFRLSEFTGDYFDVDFKDVIREKKRIIGETENYHFIETKSIVDKSFWEDELVITSDNPLIIVEGVFCYIEYPKVVSFVKELFKRYPKATLVCDVFLFDKHQCFDDLKSKIILKYPVRGEQIYKILSKLPFLKKKKKQVEVDGKEQLKGIDLIKCDSSQENNHSINYNGKSYSPQYWIGVYRRD